MIINVAAFTDKEAKEALLKYTDIRILTLKILYSIPGYASADLEIKNYFYDILKNRIEKLTFKNE